MGKEYFSFRGHDFRVINGVIDNKKWASICVNAHAGHSLYNRNRIRLPNESFFSRPSPISLFIAILTSIHRYITILARIINMS